MRFFNIGVKHIKGNIMNLYKVTLYEKKPWDTNDNFSTIFFRSWVTVADTPDGAIERVHDTLDLGLIKVIKWKVELSDDPLLIDIKDSNVLLKSDVR
jgi:hypothetical protein